MRYTKLFVALVALGVTAASPLSAAREAQTIIEDVRSNVERMRSDISDAFLQDEIVVRFRGEDRPRRIRFTPSEVEGLSVGDRIERMLVDYRSRGDVLYAEPNYIATAFGVPNDPFYSYQWHLQQIGMEEAWEVADGSGVVVAVVDTGIAQLSDLADTSFVPGYDFVNNDSDPKDDNGHGTHVAGTVAQSTNNSLGVAGVAPGVSLMPLKVLNRSGSGTYADIAEAIRYAADHGAHIINMSLGGPVGASYLEEALAYAYGKGVSMVAAAGNDGQNSVSYPAAYDNYVIAVGATRFDKARAPYSNYGASLDLVAPGGDTSVDQNGDGYGDGVLQQTFSGNLKNTGYYFFQGTSMAAPHVAGTAALLISSGSAVGPDQVRAALESTAEDLGSSGWDSFYGHGLIRPAAALGGGVSPSPSPPPPLSPDNPVEVFAESFEQGMGGWTQDSQRDWVRSRQRAADGRYAAQVDGHAVDAQLISPLIDLQEKANAAVSFSWYIEQYLDAGEYLAFDVSFDNGATWIEYARLRGDQDAEETWHQASFSISDAGSLRLRFRGTMSLSSEDANVDDIRVKVW